MTTSDILKYMKQGQVLCMSYTGEPDQPRTYWLHPTRVMIRADQALAIISCPGVKAGKDNLIEDQPSQTWRMA